MGKSRKPIPGRITPISVPSGLTEAEIVAASQPLPIHIGVYCFVRDGKVVYVGVSNDVLKRLYEHRRESVRSTGGKEFDRIAFFPCETREAADTLEYRLIRELQPEYNFSGLRDKVRTPKWMGDAPSAEDIAKLL